MGTPIFLPFKSDNGGNSLTSLNSIVIGGGIVWGEAAVPLTPLIFSGENIAKVCGSGSSWLKKLPVNNKEFCEQQFDGLPLAYKEKFYGPETTYKKPDVGGFAVGLSGGGILKAAAAAVEKQAIRLAFTKIGHKLFSSLSLDKLQSSQSLQAQLHGMHGRDDYNLDLKEIASAANLFIVQASAGVIAGIGLNVLFIGDFGPLFIPGTGIDDTLGRLPLYLWDMYQKSKVFAIIGDAAIGAILPGAQFAIIAS